MSPVSKAEWLYYCDHSCLVEVVDAFGSDNLIVAQRAAYLLDRLSVFNCDLIQPFKSIIIGVSPTDTNIPRLRHTARMLTRLNLSSAERYEVEKLLLNMAWQRGDAALQIFALRAIVQFAETNRHLREYAGPFIYDLLCRTRNACVMREAEKSLNEIEYSETLERAAMYDGEVHV
jgi:hypothetical protein